MDFQFTKDDATLVKPITQDGCGLNAGQIAGIEVEQKVLSYSFNYHGGYHGEGDSEYVYLVNDKVKGRNYPRIFLNGDKAFTVEDKNSLLKAKEVSDAKKVVEANVALFLTIAANKKI